MWELQCRAQHPTKPIQIQLVSLLARWLCAMVELCGDGSLILLQFFFPRDCHMHNHLLIDGDVENYSIIVTFVVQNENLRLKMILTFAQQLMHFVLDLDVSFEIVQPRDRETHSQPAKQWPRNCDPLQFDDSLHDYSSNEMVCIQF